MTSPPALASSPPAAGPAVALRHPQRRLFLKPMCASSSSCDLARGGSGRYQPQPQPQPRCPRLEAAQSPPPLAAGAVRRDAETGLALLLFVLAAALQQLKMTANRLAKVVEEELSGILSSLKLSFLEINDLTCQLKNLRRRLTLGRLGKESSIKASSRTGWPIQGDT